MHRRLSRVLLLVLLLDCPFTMPRPADGRGEGLCVGGKRARHASHKKQSSASSGGDSVVLELKAALRAKLGHPPPADTVSHAPAELGENDADRAATKRKHRPGSFQALGLDDKLLKGMYHAGYKFPTPVQRKVMPLVLSGRHVVAMARTGSGKTAAFLAPMIQRLVTLTAEERQHGKVIGVQGLLLLPTRELALQAFTFFKTYAKFTPLSACLLAGGESLDAQFSALAANPEVVIATPGRLLQILNEVPHFTLRRVRIVVLDEADRLFESNLAAVVQQVLLACEHAPAGIQRRAFRTFSEQDSGAGSFMGHTGPGGEMQTGGAETRVPRRQMVLISATMPRQLAEFASAGELEGHVLVRLDTEHMLSSTLRVAHIMVLPANKLACLLFLLKDVIYRVMKEEDVIDLDSKPLPWDVEDARGLTRGNLGLRRAENLFDSDSPSSTDTEARGSRDRVRHVAVAGRRVGQTKKSDESDRARRKRCMVFCATRHSVDLLVPILKHAGMLAAGVHGNMDQQQRTSALEGLKKRDIEVLVVTDVAARGLDIPMLDCVINYDFPPTPKLFVHRAGRVGRAGTVGTCHSLVTARELPFLMDTSVFLARPVTAEPLVSQMDTAAAGEGQGDGIGECQQNQETGEREDTVSLVGRSRVEVRVIEDDGNLGRKIGGEEVDNGGDFFIGAAPSKFLAYWNRFLLELLHRDSSLSPQAAAAGRGHKLYVKTCPAPSPDGVSRAKALMAQKSIHSKIHYFFRDIARRSGHDIETERCAGMAGGAEEHMEGFGTMRDYAPQGRQELPFEWQQDIWDAAAPFRDHLASKRKHSDAQRDLEALKLSQEASRKSESLEHAGERRHRAGLDIVGPLDDVILGNIGGGKGKRTMSRREKMMRAQTFICPDVDETTLVEDEGLQAFRDRALAVSSGGNMQESFFGAEGDTVHKFVLDMNADDEVDMKNRAAQRKVWDKKKRRYVNAQDLSRAQARELRFKTQTGVRKPLHGSAADGQEGALYAKWKKTTKLNIQPVGHSANLKNQHRASTKALVPLRNSRAAPDAASRLIDKAQPGGETRHAAAILAGPKRSTPALVKMDVKGVVTTNGVVAGRKARERKIRAERQRQRLAEKRHQGKTQVPEKLRKAMTRRLAGLGRDAKGLRVGSPLDTNAVLKLQERSMARSMKDLSRYKPAKTEKSV